MSSSGGDEVMHITSESRLMVILMAAHPTAPLADEPGRGAASPGVAGRFRGWNDIAWPATGRDGRPQLAAASSRSLPATEPSQGA